MSKWDYVIERLSSVRPAKTYRLSDMKTDDEVWWEESIPVPEDYETRMISELCDEVNELREMNAHLENMNTTLRNKIVALSSSRWPLDKDANRPLTVEEEDMENEDWKRVNYYAEHQTGSHPDDIGYIEIMIKDGSDEQTEKIIVDLLPEFYADVWGQNPDKIYRIVNKTAIPKLDIENMQEVWPKKAADEIVVDYGDTSIKELCKQIDRLVQENKNLSERINLLNAEIDMREDIIDDEQAYSAQVEKLVPKKKLKKFWKENYKS